MSTEINIHVFRNLLEFVRSECTERPVICFHWTLQARMRLWMRRRGSDCFRIPQVWCCDLHHATGNGPSVTEPFAEQRWQSAIPLSGCQGDSRASRWLTLLIIPLMESAPVTWRRAHKYGPEWSGSRGSSAWLRHVPLPPLRSGGTGNLSITDEFDVSWKHIQCGPATLVL